LKLAEDPLWNKPVSNPYNQRHIRLYIVKTIKMGKDSSAPI